MQNSTKTAESVGESEGYHSSQTPPPHPGLPLLPPFNPFFHKSSQSFSFAFFFLLWSLLLSAPSFFCPYPSSFLENDLTKEKSYFSRESDLNVPEYNCKKWKVDDQKQKPVRKYWEWLLGFFHSSPFISVTVLWAATWLISLGIKALTGRIFNRKAHVSSLVLKWTVNL